MPNLTLRQRDGVWHVSGSIGGERIRKSLGTRDRARAEELRAQLEARLWKRHTYGEEAVRTFEEAALSYMAQGGERAYLPALIKHFRGRNVGSIAAGDIREAAIELYPSAGPATRNRQGITPARAVINHAHSRKWCPPIRVKLFKVARSRKSVPVDRAWLDAFMARADADGLPHLSGIVLFMHQTGARVSEAVRLMGAQVNLSKRLALLERTKNGEPSVRHLTAELALRMGALGIEDAAPVFRYTDRCAVTRRMKEVCKRAGIEPRSSHAAGRHSFGTNAMKGGARVKAAMEAGGWKSARLFLETYVHDGEGGQDVASIFDRQTGPIGTDLATAARRKGYRFGPKG